MTNKARWDLYHRDCGSPQVYLDAAFYYMISSALRRCVWSPPEHSPLYSNMYIILCGPPALGKGQVIQPLNRFLSWNKKKKMEQVDEGVDGEIAKLLENKKRLFEPSLIPMGAHATTWQALIDAFVDAYEPLVIGRDASGKIARYHHSSLCFCLEELSSLFKEQTNDLANFFLTGFDCGDYIYDTRKKTRDKIRNMCLNFIAGTTPKFMSDVLGEGILSDGFSSRTIFAYAEEPRHKVMWRAELDIDQKIAEKELLLHVRELTKLYGCVKYSKEAYIYLHEWWTSKKGIPRVNPSPKLDSYYGRKDILLKKMSMAMHFADCGNLTEEISLQTVLNADRFLCILEVDAHKALETKSVNPLSGPGKHLLAFLKSKKQATRNEIGVELFPYLEKAKEDLNDLLEAFVEQGRIEKFDDSKNRMAFRLKEGEKKI